jgi:hypothetical protein
MAREKPHIMAAPQEFPSQVAEDHLGAPGFVRIVVDEQNSQGGLEDKAGLIRRASGQRFR